MQKTIRAIVAFALAALLFSSPARAVVLGPNQTFTQDVFCEDVYMGTFNISSYFTYKVAAAEPGFSNPNSGGVRIRGQFTPAPAFSSHEFRYLQAITHDDDPLAWRGDGTTLVTAPYIDTPPGGYVGANNAFDFIPYYDEGEFPLFFDQPSTGLVTSKTGNITVDFETWLVCVVDEKSDYVSPAKNDLYTVATLLGFKWGYTLSYLGDLAPPGDSLNDFDVTKTAFGFLAAPSADWNTALGKVYGAGANTDRYNVVAIDDCEQCRNIPEPLTASMFTLSFAAAALALLRRRAA